MNPINIVKSLTRNEPAAAQKTTFRPGQIVSGKVMKHFPGQTAEVQIGGQKVIAQLETALSAGARYWFQVQPAEGQIHLKVLETAAGNSAATPDGLLGQLQLSVSKENLSLVSFFQSERLPITKEVFKLAAEWLQGNNSEQTSLLAMKEMLSRQLPFTKNVFNAIVSILKNDSLVDQLNSLEHHLEQSSKGETAARLTNVLQVLTSSAAERNAQQSVMRLVNEWLANGRQESLEMLKTAGVLPPAAREADSILQLASKLAEMSKRDQILPNLLQNLLNSNDSGNKQQFLLTLTKLQGSMKSEDGQQQVMKLIADIRTNAAAFPLKQENLLPLMKAAAAPLFSSQDTAMMINKKLLDNVNFSVFTSQPESGDLDAVSLKEQLQSAIKASGFSYEKMLLDSLSQSDSKDPKLQDTLKPLLMKLLSEEHPTAVKEGAEKLLSKLTGFQLLSQEVGPIQQYAFQIPFSLSESMKNLTMQWSGRKTADGKIDPDYCRVLFYLELDHLSEAVIDMHVQNRIMSISVINENERIETFAHPVIEELKENLAKQNYHLSYVEFKQPKSSEKISISQKPAMQQTQFSGVDIRV